ncbi:MAG: FHIPEP family type III secretion protein, partial [Rhodobiaceae bacterium]|nr:FHIPEP family type III secretion protein [Rhodobiaceae bacterium]
IITFINVIGGIIIGVGQMDLTFSEASATYTLLTVGDGLVSQIPALIVSVAAGLLVSKAGVSEDSDTALVTQLSSYPKALGMTSGVMAGLSLLPGIPMLPFLALSAGAGALAWSIDKSRRQQVVEAEQAEIRAAEPAAPAEEPISAALAIDDIKLEVGYGLLPLVNSADGEDRLTGQIKALRRQLAQELGFVMPPVRVLDNVQLDANAYVVRIKEVDSGSGTVFPNQVMVMNPAGGQIDLPGFHTTEPTFGLPATWCEESQRDRAEMKGYTVVDPATVISTHLTESVKANMAELLSYADVSKMLSELPKDQQKLVDDIVPGQVSMSSIQRVLQHLLTERVSIRDLPTILEGIAEASGFARSPQALAEHVRTRLSRQLCAQHLSPGGYLPIISLSPDWEHAFSQALIGEGEERQLAMAPSKLQTFVQKVRDAFEKAASEGELPVLLTSGPNRPHVRAIVERFRPQTTVMSQNEVHTRVRLKTLGNV